MAGNKRKRQITTVVPSSAKKAEAAEVALRTSNGVLLEDPERVAKQPIDWTDDELKAWGLYELPASEFEGNSLDEELAAVARERFEYPAGWSVATVRDVLAGGQPPASTSNGLLVEDIERDAKPLAEWSASELFALYNGELISKYNFDDPDFVEAVRGVVAKEVGEPHDAAEWTEEHLLNWLLTRRVPVSTERGNYVDSATRPDKAVSEWTDSELIDWLDRKIGATAEQHAELLPEVHKRFKLDDSIVADDALIVINGGELPRSASGVQLRDIIRDQKLPEDWTKDELTAWARNEIPLSDRVTFEQLRLELAYAYELEEHATVEQVLAFIDSGLPPPKALANWTDAELEKALEQEPESVSYKAELLKRAKQNAPKAWSDEECIRNWRTNEQPARTASGVWVQDVTRSGRIVTGLSHAEIKAWATGEITLSDEDEVRLIGYLRLVYPDVQSYWLEDLKAYFASDMSVYSPKVEGTNIQIRDRFRDATPVKEWGVEEMRLAFNNVIERPFGLVEEMRERVQAPLSWSYDQYTKAFMDPAYTPERTESGHWLNDAVRDNRPMDQWTDEEIIGLITGELTSKVWTHELLVKAVRSRRQFPEGLSDEQVLQAFATGTDPHHEAAHEEVTAEALKPPVDNEPALSKLHRYANGKLTLNPVELTVYVSEVRSRYGIEPTWSDNVIIDWAGKLVDFNVNRDVMLRFLLAELWSADDLRRWLNGELDLIGGPNKVQLMYQVRRRFIVPDDVEDADVRAYLFEKNKQEITDSGVIVNDPKREFLSASKWSKDELMAWCRGEITGTKGTTDATLRAAVTAQWEGIQPQWSLEQVKRFVAIGDEPHKTTTGVWVVDITRDDRVPGAWSEAELKAWVMNEIKSKKYTAEQILRAVRVVFRLSDKWNDAEVIEYIALGNSPEQTDGVLVNDPSRDKRTAEQWTNDELRAFARGKISASHLATAEKLTAVIGQRFGMPAWSDEQVLANLRDGSLPPTASTGVWITDVVRDQKSAEEWDMAELRAWAMGEIRSGKNVTDKALLAAGRKAISILVDGSVAQWSDQEVHRWLKTGAKPIKSSGGFFKGCPRRALRGAQEWSKGELIDFIKGELSETAKAPTHDLWDAIYVKWEIPVAWSQAEAKAYVLFDRIPAKTVDGKLWIRDTLREVKPAAHWNAEELKAWARGELTATKAAPEADLVAEARIRYHMSESRPADSLKRVLATLKEEPLKMSIQFIAQNLESYGKGMGMGVKVTDLEAAGFQTQLYHTMTRCLTLEGRDFTEGWTKILDFVHNNANGMFATERAYRGIQQLRMSDRDKKNFEALLDLAIRTSDPSTRYSSAKRTNLEVSLRGIPSEPVRQLVRAYYQVH